MINIIDYESWLATLRSEVNNQMGSDMRIESCLLAADASQLTKRLADRTGFILCSSFPDAELDARTADNYSEDNRLFLYILHKAAPGELTYQEELLLYAKLQEIMQAVKMIILSSKADCNLFQFSGKIRTEWEYNQFGGYNGLSIGLNVGDYD